MKKIRGIGNAEKPVGKKGILKSRWGREG